jgi:RNA polymerase sigma-70 factor (ECF subfamily)
LTPPASADDNGDFTDLPHAGTLTVDDASLALVARWREGDQQAATELFQRYAQRLIGLARNNLSNRLSNRLDPEDVVQSVCRSFFAGARDGRYVLQQSGDLWRLLVSITLNKLHDKARRQTAQKRSVNREQSFGSEDSLFGIQAEVLARDPSPEEATTLVDLLEELLRPFEGPQRRMIELRLQGYPLDEIAADTGHCRHTVMRVLKRVREHLEQGGGTEGA